MLSKSKVSLFAAIIMVALFYNCQMQKNQDKKETNNIEMEQMVIYSPQGNSKGFFTDNPQLIDRVEISYYQQMVSKKAKIEKTVTQQDIITELIQPLIELPTNGDIFVKLSPQSSLYSVKFFVGQTKVGEAKIFNKSLQMSNTAFLKEDNINEDIFVDKIVKITNMD
jgi:TRAP-type C4-dicarboxylate transport system substrate-binding protein